MTKLFTGGLVTLTVAGSASTGIHTVQPPGAGESEWRESYEMRCILVSDGGLHFPEVQLQPARWDAHRLNRECWRGRESLHELRDTSGPRRLALN